ncbi:MAG: helix-turn-helix transcriptional regulator, partial [Clostridia bacterium]|nr:helix-turn-helix transcriptional regulator [Clostridia bacterium]
AKELGYHEKYLSTAFHKATGIPLKRYLVSERLNEAKRLLADTNYTVAEVAYYLNFENPHNFSRFFKKECGITPLEYRTQLTTDK